MTCFKLALKLKVDIVNYSSYGKTSSFLEYKAVKDLSDHNIKIIVASGNNGEDLLYNDSFPAKYPLKNLIPVGNLHNSTSNYGLNNMIWEDGNNIYSTLPNGKFGYMTGTSQATAKYTNKLLKEMCND